LSVRATWVLFVIEFVLVTAVCTVVLVRGGDAGLTTAPFDLAGAGPDAWSGIALGMVFCVFSFVGFEGAVSFAEETPNPRKALPVAVIGGVVAMLLLYVIGTYAAVVGFGTASIDALAGDGEPIATLATRFVPVLGPLLAFAVFTSIAANLMAAGNANARVLFSMGRQGAVASGLGRVHERTRTPAVAIVTFMACTGVLCLVAGARWDYLTSFGNIAGFGALLAIVVYMLATIALPVYLRRRGERLHPVRHISIPVIGAIIWLVPLWGSLKPGQAYPASVYPIIGAVLVVAVSLFAIVAEVRRRGRTAGPVPLETEFGSAQPPA
jgi:amino acid transporter